MMRPTSLLIAIIIASVAGACRKAESSPPPETPGPVGKILAYAEPGLSGCEHDIETSTVVEHSWPYPAEARDIRWGTTYQRVKLKLKPQPAAFYTATITWKDGELIPVEDSEVVIRKPRQVVAKHDLMVTRKVVDQGREVERTAIAVAAGEVANFLFYNSRGFCMILTDDGPAWAQCTLDGSFEGVSEEEPFACEQTWWVEVRKSRSDRGWMPFDEAFMDRVPPPADAAK